MTIEQLIDEKNGNVGILDLIKYPELHDLEVKPVENITNYEMYWDLSEPAPVWRWTEQIYRLANMISVYRPEVENIYRELMSVNFKVVQ